ncbi:ABC transporter ATP-binding protein [Aliicoccus persicus]|uniref:Peptide/nickel transport system ATP-binding protein n=1 Tax=Aliicoccus persicus TaxID=930138 RepID=A0A662Z5H8_9STAP|nr:ABC transporter ATP-binding protein [Aliicoccus persicus]SEW19667.1 peptide/nickel transport system ATP-binding protein [Aliicoccus persicus]
MSNENLLEIKELRTSFKTEEGKVPSVDGVSFQIKKGEVVALVGESGSGKSVTALSVLDILASNGRIEGGEILFNGQNLTKYNEQQMRKIRGNDISMIFQEPLTSLNPVFKVGEQMTEALHAHQKISKSKAKEKSIEMLDKVGIPRANKVFNSYPHSLSGGMRQRVMIAIALMCDPKLLIADEPTTALDVTIQAQILKLLKEVIKKFDTSILLITHDLGVVAEMADRVAVMYCGQIVEETDVFTLFKNPKHPYTKGLIDSTPKINQLDEKLRSIPGSVPSPLEYPAGCRFADRCPHTMSICLQKVPNDELNDENHLSRCFLHSDELTDDEKVQVKVN